MLLLAVLIFVLPTEATSLKHPFFDYEDPDNGKLLKCSFCPPGTYMDAPCSSTHDTLCLPCPKDRFTEFNNYLPRCLYCTNFCVEEQIVKSECSATHNRVCECKNGYYWHEYFCAKHTRCRPGSGAKLNGDAQRDTQCEMCPDGTFSEQMSSSEQCKSHTDCGQLLLALPGRTWHDNVCASCADLQNGGYVEVIRGILPGFFTHKHFRPNKLRRFTELMNGKRDQLTSFDAKPLSISSILKWTEEATKDQLKDLPKMLKRSGLSDAAKKFSKMFDILEKASRCHI